MIKLMTYTITPYIKFGIGRTTYDASQEIRNGLIDRDEAKKLLVEKYDRHSIYILMKLWII